VSRRRTQTGPVPRRQHAEPTKEPSPAARGNYVELLVCACASRPGPGPLRTATGSRKSPGAALPSATVSLCSPPDPAGQAALDRSRCRGSPTDRDVIGAGRLRVADDMKSLAAYSSGHLEKTMSSCAPTVAANRISRPSIWRQEQTPLARRLPARRNDADRSRPPTTARSARSTTAHGDLAAARRCRALHSSRSAGDKAFARMGSPVTVASRAPRSSGCSPRIKVGSSASIWPRRGKPLSGFPIRPESPEWSFEGPPLVQDGALYVAMRHVEGSRSQVYVACFELATTLCSQQRRPGRSRPSRSPPLSHAHRFDGQALERRQSRRGQRPAPDHRAWHGLLQHQRRRHRLPSKPRPAN
jgi:hypothetical protein